MADVSHVVFHVRQIRLDAARTSWCVQVGWRKLARYLSALVKLPSADVGVTQLRQYNGKTDARRKWAAVRQLTGRQQTICSRRRWNNRINVKRACRHHLDWSAVCRPDPRKQLATDTNTPLEYVSEWEVFRMLDNLQPTADRLVGLYQRGSSGWQRPYSAKQSLICSTCRLLHPQYRGSAKKLRSNCYLKYQHRSNT